MQYSMAEKKRRLLATLEKVTWSPSAAAAALGVSRATIYRWMRELGIEGRPRGE